MVRRVAFHLALQGLRRARRSPGLAGRSDPAREPLRLTAEQLDLVQALGRLSLRHRQVLALHYLADLPVEEIARDLALPVGTVKSRLARARQRLAAQLTDGKEADRDHIRGRAAAAPLGPA
jgi:RNA polymerase sigma factor (sigma-70 family)